MTSEVGKVIRSHWDVYADKYRTDIQQHVLQSRSFYYLLERLKKVKGTLSGGLWLDAGCGPGCFSSSILNENYTALIGVDMSTEMVRIAEKKSIYRAVYHGSLCNLDMIEDAQVSVYFSNNVFHFVNVLAENALNEALAEAFRVLKDKGILALNMSGEYTSHDFIQECKKIVKKECEKRGEYDENTNPQGVKVNLVREYPIGSISIASFEQKVEEQGFKIQDAVMHSEHIDYPNKSAYIAAMSTYAKYLYLLPFHHLSDQEKEDIYQEMVDQFLVNEQGPYRNIHYMNYIVASKCKSEI